MRLAVKENTTSNNYELIFSELPPSDLIKVLREVGFTKSKFGGNIYTISKFPVYHPFIASLQKLINTGKYWDAISSFPIFEPTHDSINKSLFTIVTIYYMEDAIIKEQDYLIFELYQKSILTLVYDFGTKKYGNQFQDSKVFPRKLKRQARKLLDSNYIIDRLKVTISDANTSPDIKIEQSQEKEAELINDLEVVSTNEQEIEPISVTEQVPANDTEVELIIDAEVEQSNEIKIESTNDIKNESSFIRTEIAKIISELENDDRGFGGIIKEMLFDLKEIELYSTDEVRKTAIKKATNKYKGWLKDTIETERNFTLTIINRLLLLLDDTNHELEIKKGALSIKRTIWVNDKVIQNVLVPIHAKEPFLSGDVKLYEVDKIKTYFEDIFNITDDTLHKASSLDLFYLAQLIRPRSFGIAVGANMIEIALKDRGSKVFEELGFPTDLKYPYVSIHLGYFKILPLGIFIDRNRERYYNDWWFALKSTRPLMDFDKALVVINLAIEKLQTGKLRQDKEPKKAYDEIDFNLTNLNESKLAIEDYLDSKELEASKGKKTSNSELTFASDATIYSELRHELQDVISELISMEDNLDGEQETIIATTIHDLEAVAEIADQTKFTDELQYSIEMFKNWVSDLEPEIRDQSATLINRLINHVGGSTIAILSEKNSLVIAKDIEQYDRIVENVLVPTHAKEPFQSGKVFIKQAEDLKKNFPNLYAIKTNELHQVSALELFQLSQMSHPTDYGMQVYRGDLLQEWENRGIKGFEQLGFPTAMNYPYVNIHTGYRSVSTLGGILGIEDDSFKWWAVVEHGRPIANLPKGIVIIDNLIAELLTELQKYINPKTKRPLTKPEYKEAYSDISFKVSRLKLSRQVITNYLDAQVDQEEEPTQEPLPNTKEDYIDRVVATMHLAYREGKRLSKKKIENLQEQTGAPSLGELWEAVELSWLLWYKMLYNEPISFEARLSKMIHFWNTIQPTYAYSDSSKELYKQYSTSCPIGAIIAQYTKMDSADSIFEPSAGNGLLLVGANPKITHVNEIDKSRKKSLEFQQFQKITMDNAAQAFPIEMEKAFDVMVTNPPFASWDEDKFDKERIIKKYFHNSRGLASYLRLEHVMAGLALRTLKDNGKAAIIIMGHVYFDDNGFIAKYRPFFNWLYRYYKVDDIINMNSFKLYNKQGAVAKTMLILIGGRKTIGEGVAPKQSKAPHLDKVIDTFDDLWEEVKLHITPNIHTIIKQLQIAKTV